MKEYEGNELLNLLDTWGRYLAFRRRLLNFETSIDEIFEGMVHEKKLAGNSENILCYEDPFLPLKLIEKALEDEVTLAYYLNLMDSCLNLGNKSLQRGRPKQVFTEDVEIKNLLRNYVRDLSNLHESELNKIRTVSAAFDF